MNSARIAWRWWFGSITAFLASRKLLFARPPITSWIRHYTSIALQELGIEIIDLSIETWVLDFGEVIVAHHFSETSK